MSTDSSSEKYRVACSCGFQMWVLEHHVGRTGMCRKCGSPITITRNMLSSSGRPLSGEGDLPLGLQREWAKDDIVLNLYQVLGLLGEGGMGKVYKVHHLAWQTDLAVKCPRKEMFRSRQQRENFQRECETWSRLGLHPHIVCCHYVREVEGVPRVFAEYMDCGSLRDWIDRRWLYAGGDDKALARMLDFAIQFAWGLHFAHENELVHQDVKPANVLVTREGVLKVTDFGLAEARGATEDFTQDLSGVSILASYGGMTQAYCSPEQAEIAALAKAGVEKEKWPHLSRRTDIYSWAVSICEMFNGCVSWPSGCVVTEVLREYAESNREIPGIPAMPDALVSLLSECLDQSAESRPGSMWKVADRLRHIYRDTVGTPYTRSEPKAVLDMADSLNNRGLSLLDLGNTEAAERCFDEALQLDPGHAQATFNRGVLNWRRGVIDDNRLVARLEQIHRDRPDDDEICTALSWLHVERRDFTSAATMVARVSNSEYDGEVSNIRRRIEDHGNGKSEARHFLDARGLKISALALDSFGKRLVAGTRDRKMRLWTLGNTSTPMEWGELKRPVNAVVWDNRQERIFSAGGHLDNPGELAVWNANNGKMTYTYSGHAWEVNCAALSGNGEWVVTGGSDGKVILWKGINSGAAVQHWTGSHPGIVCAVAITLDGRRIFSAGEDGMIRVWDPAQAECVSVLKGHKGKISAIDILPDGRRVLSAGHDQSVRLWDPASGYCVMNTAEHKGEVIAVRLTRDGRWALSAGRDNTIRRWETGTGRCIRTFQLSNTFQAVAFSEDARWIAVASGDDSLLVWDNPGFESEQELAPWRLCRVVKTEKALELQDQFLGLVKQARVALNEKRIPKCLGHIQAARSLQGFERNTEIVAINREVGNLCGMENFRGCSEERLLKGHQDDVNAVAIGHEKPLILSGGRDKKLRQWSLDDYSCVRIMEGHDDTIWAVDMGDDSNWALTGAGGVRDFTLRLWHLESARSARTFEGHQASILSVCLSRDKARAFSGSADKTIRIWDVETGRCMKTLEGHSAPVVSLSLSGNEQWLLSGAQDGILILWDTKVGRKMCEIATRLNPLKSAYLSRDGRVALSGGSGGNIDVWNVASGAYAMTLTGHTAAINALEIGQEMRWALSGSSDQTVRIWDIISGECVRTLETSLQSVQGVSMSPHGHWIAAAGSNGCIGVWELDWDYHHAPQAYNTLQECEIQHNVAGGAPDNDGARRLADANHADQRERATPTGLRLTPPPLPEASASGAAPESAACVSFKSRCAAHLIDIGLLSLPFMLLLINAISPTMARVNSSIAEAIMDDYQILASGISSLFLVCVGIFSIACPYFVILESSRWQGTPGKIACGILVTDMAGMRITFAKAMKRYLARLFISLGTLGTGYLVVLFTAKSRSLHDKVVGTQVLHTDRRLLPATPLCRLSATFVIASFLLSFYAQDSLQSLLIDSGTSTGPRLGAEYELKPIPQARPVSLLERNGGASKAELPLEARFTADDTVGKVPLKVRFADESKCTSQPITSWEWDFGDGGTSTEKNPVHIYETPGTYPVSLLVRSSRDQNTQHRDDYIIVMPNAATGSAPPPAPTTQTIATATTPLDPSSAVPATPSPPPPEPEVKPEESHAAGEKAAFAGIAFHWCPPGTFMMGNPDVRRERNNDEAPQHKVTLTRGFWMSETEITQAQWVAVMGTNPSNFIDDNKPVERVSWNDISEPSSGFLAKLNAAHPESIFRLPTEAEWEYACRAGTTSPYYWGEDTRKVLLENHAWYYSNSNSSTHPVAKKAPNTWGLYDMSGNVREWCADWYAYYSGNATSNPRGPSTGTKRVNRGGCWVEDTSTCRASDRYSDMPEYKYFGNGFRIVKQ